MAELNKIRFLFFVSSMIFSTQALSVVFTDGVTLDLWYTTEIQFNITDGQKFYVGRSTVRTYHASPNTAKAILYITSYSKMRRQILKHEYLDKRLQIAEQLSKKKFELLYLGVKDYAPGDERLIGEFILETVTPNPQQLNFTIETIGEDQLNRNFSSTLRPFKKYEEDRDVCGQSLRGILRSLSIKEGKGCKDGGEDCSKQNTSVIFPKQSLPVIFTDGVSVDLWYATEIKFNFTHGNKYYLGRSSVNTYYTNRNTTKAILYIASYSKMTRKILKNYNRPQRLKIAEQLGKKNYELLYLGVKGFTLSDTHLISEFILETIKHYPEQRQSFTIETIGEDNLDQNFSFMLCPFKKYKEDPEICGNDLHGLLRKLSITEGGGSSSAPSASEIRDHSDSSIRKRSRRD